LSRLWKGFAVTWPLGGRRRVGSYCGCALVLALAWHFWLPYGCDKPGWVTQVTLFSLSLAAGKLALS
jgi:hypothetical protein